MNVSRRGSSRRGVPTGNVESELLRSPGAVIVNTIARLQLDMEELLADPLCHQTWGGPTSPRRSRQTTFTSTIVQTFTGVTSWEKYRHVFDAIVLSNGWDDATAALQLLSHLEGDAPFLKRRPGRSGRTRLYLQPRWKPWQLRLSGIWSKHHDFRS